IRTGMTRVAKTTKKTAKHKPVAKKPAAKAASAKAAAAKKTAAKARPAPRPAVKHAPAKPAAKAHPKVETKAAAAAKAKQTAAELAAQKKPGVIPAKVAAKVPLPKGAKPGENETPGDADSPLLDMSDVGVRKMIARAKARGYVTYDELNKVLLSDKTSSKQIEDTMSMINEMGINVIESEEQEEQGEGDVPALAEGKQVATKTEGATEQYDRTDD